MKNKPLVAFALLALLLSGCSRTVEDIARWESNGNEKKLIDALQDPKVEIRITSAEALGDLKAESAVNALGVLYNDTEDEAILAAVNALAAIGSESTTTPLIAALKLKNSDARLTAATALGEMKATGAVGALGEALSDREEEIQYAAAHSLGQIGDEKGSQPLAEKLKSGSEKHRLACMVSLEKIGGKVATASLIGVMDDKRATVRNAAIGSLVTLGNPSVPYALEALKDDNVQIRRGAISVLKSLDAVPATGSDHIWFLLARVSTDNQKIIDIDVVSELEKIGNAAVETLLVAAAHPVPDFREHAFLALENIGETCTARAIDAANALASPTGKAWFYGRNEWIGDPDWHLDLWAAVAVLNPAFGGVRESIPIWITQLSEPNPQSAITQLIHAGKQAVFPLIAACGVKNSASADPVAKILGEIGDIRAAEALMVVFKRKISIGEPLSNSPFYNALLKLNVPTAEPLLLKVRPNPYRAMRMFERKYPSLRAISAESRDAPNDYDLPIVFRVGYVNNGKLDEFEISFAKNWQGDWKPAPPLPDLLP